MGITGEVQEWLNWHAWKACVPQKGTEGSNPSLSAKFLFLEIICSERKFSEGRTEFFFSNLAIIHVKS